MTEVDPRTTRTRIIIDIIETPGQKEAIKVDAAGLQLDICQQWVQRTANALFIQLVRNSILHDLKTEAAGRRIVSPS